MKRSVHFDEHTEITLSEPTTIRDIHLKDLSFVLDITHQDGNVEECVLDMQELLKVVTAYSAQDKFRYGWRRRWRDESK